ncbi:MAG: alpha/beta hydrolase [Granulosicoccus sp.]
MTGTSQLVLVLLLFVLSGGIAMSVDNLDEFPLDFNFVKSPTGQLIQLETHRLHLDCRGEGSVTVLLEAGLGGVSLEWDPVQQILARRTRTCSYDRAGYGWSDPSPFPRDARQLAREADAMLRAADIGGPLLLVGHSFGGFVIRELHRRRKKDVIGMVLVDSSHEDQFRQMESSDSKPMMPRGKNFVISPVGVPENLPLDIRKKIAAFSRMRKTYSATHSEMTWFRQSAEQVRRGRKVLDIPVTVLQRGLNPYAEAGISSRDIAGSSIKSRVDVKDDAVDRNEQWNDLQANLVLLSGQGRLVVAEQSGHHIHSDEPELVAAIVEEMLDDYEKP